jgi:hypothetical protein
MVHSSQALTVDKNDDITYIFTETNENRRGGGWGGGGGQTGRFRGHIAWNCTC